MLYALSLLTAAIHVHLVDGPDRYSGRVVITYNGVNGTVCDDSFGVSDARVLCRMAGFRCVILTVHFVAGESMIFI